MSMNKMDEFEARAAAARTGKKRYTSVIPCIRDHLGERYTSSGNCIECLKRFKPVDVPKVNESQHIFTFSIALPNHIDLGDDARCYLAEALRTWFDANPPLGGVNPISGGPLQIMRATGKPFGTVKFEDMDAEARARFK